MGLGDLSNENADKITNLGNIRLNILKIYELILPKISYYFKVINGVDEDGAAQPVRYPSANIRIQIYKFLNLKQMYKLGHLSKKDRKNLIESPFITKTEKRTINWND